MERRLTTILATDVVGYSALIRADEEGTRAAVRQHNTETIEPQVAAHRGRIFKTVGDGLLAEFASVVDAVRCAVEIQAAIKDHNTDVAADKLSQQASRLGCPSAVCDVTAEAAVELNSWLDGALSGQAVPVVLDEVLSGQP